MEGFEYYKNLNDNIAIDKMKIEIDKYNNMNDIEFLNCINNLNNGKLRKYKNKKIYIDNEGFTFDRVNKIKEISIENIRKYINLMPFIKKEKRHDNYGYYHLRKKYSVQSIIFTPPRGC